MKRNTMSEECIPDDVVSRVIREILDIKDGTETELPLFCTAGVKVYFCSHVQ
jgi:hypothetical protein